MKKYQHHTAKNEFEILGLLRNLLYSENPKVRQQARFLILFHTSTPPEIDDGMARDELEPGEVIFSLATALGTYLPNMLQNYLPDDNNAGLTEFIEHLRAVYYDTMNFLEDDKKN